MVKKTLAGLAIGCVLSTPAAFAEEYRGFYFGVWGGSGSIDMPSKAAFDEVMGEILGDEVASGSFTDDNNTPTVLTDDTSVDFALLGTGESSLDDSVSVWGLQVGYRWGKYFASEVGYAKLGEATYRLPALIEVTVADSAGTSTSDFVGERAVQFTSAGPTISALGMLPLGERFELHLRGGIYLADTRVTNRIRDIQFNNGNIYHVRTDASQTELYAGVGGAWNINQNFVLRAEYQRFLDVGDEEKTGESDIDVFNLSVLFK